MPPCASTKIPSNSPNHDHPDFKLQIGSFHHPPKGLILANVNDVRPEGSGHINKMSEDEATHSQTQKLINYNAINDTTMHKLYRTARVPLEGSAEEQPLKKFH